MPPRLCTLSNPPTRGTWDAATRTFSTLEHADGGGCTLRQLDSASASRCLRNRTLIFMGDSNIRDLGVATASFLAGVAPELAEASKFDKESPFAWAARYPERRDFFNTSASQQQPSLWGQGYTHPVHGWTVRVLHRSYHTAWQEFLNTTRHASPATTLAFVNLGSHASAAKSMRDKWHDDALARTHFLHGYVMQPFVDHYCQAHARSEQQHSEAKEARSELHQQQHSTAALNGTARAAAPHRERASDHRAGSELPARLVWMTHNHRCGEFLPSKYRVQVNPLAHANHAAVEVGHELHFPVLDWNFLAASNGAPHTGTARAPPPPLPLSLLHTAHSAPAPASVSLEHDHWLA